MFLPNSAHGVSFHCHSNVTIYVELVNTTY